MATITTEDGAAVQEGDRVYNYYDMEPGIIVPGTAKPNGGDLWFRFRSDEGNTAILNGARICTIAFAQRRGFRGV